MKKLSWMVLVLIWSTCSYAVDDLYPCNVELKRPVSEPGDTGTFYARIRVEDLDAGVDSPQRFKNFTVIAPKNGNWVSMVSPADEFHFRIVDLQFPGSLNRLGVGYRVGFCYQGPIRQGNNPRDPGEDSTQGSYGLIGTLNAGTLTDSISYFGTVSGYCDLREVGMKKKSRTPLELNPLQIEADSQFLINLGKLESGEIGFENLINDQVTQVPRFCKVNIEIEEGSAGVRPAENEVSQPQFTLQIDR